MSALPHEALMRRAIETIWNRRHLDVGDQLFAPGYVNHYGLIADLVLGPEAIKLSAALYRVLFPGLHVSVEDISTVEDTVVLRWTAEVNARADEADDTIRQRPENRRACSRVD